MSEDTVAAGTRTPLEERRHPLHVFAGRLSAALDELAGVSPLSMGVAETVETTVELTRAVSQLRGLQLAVLTHADRLDVAATVDATSTAGWLRSLLPVTGPGATRDVTLAARLDREAHTQAAAALAAGRVLADQAEVILTAVDALPASVTVEDRQRAEAHLVDLAATHDAAALRLLGRRVLEVIDPDAADAELARRLEAEAAAARATSLTLSDDGHGTTPRPVPGPDPGRRDAPYRTARAGQPRPTRPDRRTTPKAAGGPPRRCSARRSPSPSSGSPPARSPAAAGSTPRSW